MTEAEWLKCTDPRPMLEFLHGKASDRKLRLFALACFRPYRFMLVPETLEALEVAERLAEGTISPLERKRARERAFHAGRSLDRSLAHRRGPAKHCVTSLLSRDAYDAAFCVAHAARNIGVLSKKDWPAEALEMTEWGPRIVDWSAGKREQESLQAGLLREIFGNPFRAVSIDRSRLTPGSVMLARSIYEDQAFGHVPELVESLTLERDAPELMAHLTEPGPHIRGCWALDLILGNAEPGRYAAEEATRSRLPGFATVRAVCYGCGWYRILGPTGTDGVTRALIRVERARNPCNVLWTRVMTVPAKQPPSDLASRFPNYRDLEHEWHYRRPARERIEAHRPYWELVKDQPCPRCKRPAPSTLDVYRETSSGVSWRVPCWVPA